MRRVRSCHLVELVEESDELVAALEGGVAEEQQGQGQLVGRLVRGHRRAHKATRSRHVVLALAVKVSVAAHRAEGRKGMKNEEANKGAKGGREEEGRGGREEADFDRLLAQLGESCIEKLEVARHLF